MQGDKMIPTDLFEFAYVPDWYGQLDELAAMTLPESWRFKKPTSETKNIDTPILESYAIIEKEMCERGENAMTQESVLDRATYKKIKSMGRAEMQNFLTNYYHNVMEDASTSSVDLKGLRAELSNIKGVGEKRLDEIMSVIEKHLVVSNVKEN